MTAATHISNEPERVSGTIQRVIAKSADTGWAVLEVLSADTPITVVGNLAHVDEGLRIEADGNWNSHPKFGRQFKATSARVFAPIGKEGIERFLKSGAVEGIGPVFAKKIVDKFGDETLRVIDKQHWRLKYLKGVGPKRINAVVRGVKEYRERMEVMSFLHGKLGPIRAQRVYEKYGDKARETIAENPYRLIEDFDGVGFVLADQVARDVGVDANHPLRRRAAVLTALKQASIQGHTCLATDDCRKRVNDLVLDSELANLAIEEARGDGEWHFVEREGVECLELKRYRYLEGRITERLEQIRSSEWVIPVIDAEKAIPWAEGRVNIALETGQRDAVATALKEKVAVITGGPGVGKTTILNSLIRILRAKKLRICLAAPTGRAARRMSESTGHDAETIHKLLEYSPKQGGFARNRGNELEAEVVIIDEASMIDVSLARSLLEATPDTAKLILVGDKDQLPSVGPGQFLADVLSSNVVPVASLTKPFRQAANSPIIRNAHLVNAGMVPDLDGMAKEFQFIETKNADETARHLVETICMDLPDEGIRPREDVMCLIPMHRGAVGVENINRELQERLNGDPKDQIQRGERRYGVGDKVIQTKNNRELMVFNGDIGCIEAIDHGDKLLRIRFDQQAVDYPFGDLSALSLAYAITVHKSQGGQNRCVVVAVDRSNTVLLNRRLLYTAITRAQERVVLIGQKRAVHMAVSEGRAHIRSTMLKDRLVEAFRS